MHQSLIDLNNKKSLNTFGILENCSITFFDHKVLNFNQHISFKLSLFGNSYIITSQQK